MMREQEIGLHSSDSNKLAGEELIIPLFSCRRHEQGAYGCHSGIADVHFSPTSASLIGDLRGTIRRFRWGWI